MKTQTPPSVRGTPRGGVLEYPMCALDAGQHPKPILTGGIGRNEDLFGHCIKLAHQPK